MTRAGIKEFTAAYANWDAAGFAAAASLFRQAAANPPASCANDYWLGVAQFPRKWSPRNVVLEGLAPP